MNKKAQYTFLIIVGLLAAYIYQMSPAPVLELIAKEYAIKNDALLNLAVSIMYPSIILASILGEKMETRIGLRALFTLTLFFLACGMLTNLIAINYAVFLLGRIVFGFGFGLGIPFIGSAISLLYTGSQRDAMNTLNGLFPYAGTLLTYAVTMPLVKLLSSSWKFGLSLWGVVVFLVCLSWLFTTSKKDFITTPSQAEASVPAGLGIYREIWKRREIRLICIIFMGDFFCYSYVAAILPTFLSEAGSISNTAAGVIAAIAFPGLGVLGCLLGGGIMNRFHVRRPCLIIGPAAEVAGIMAMLFLSLITENFILAALGIGLFGFGGGIQMPAIYSVPMDLDGMTSQSVGAAFALLSSCAFICGFISPSIGGLLTNIFSSIQPTAGIAAHVSGLKISLILFGVSNAIALLCALLMPETGKRHSFDRE